ncbi:MAG TPA: hypothetical protein VLF88_03230 [Candidatus Babeliales bacterium]|nr:hypothetical protein [Candidatus Babeliales bacterium]
MSAANQEQSRPLTPQELEVNGSEDYALAHHINEARDVTGLPVNTQTEIDHALVTMSRERTKQRIAELRRPDQHTLDKQARRNARERREEDLARRGSVGRNLGRIAEFMDEVVYTPPPTRR